MTLGRRLSLVLGVTQLLAWATTYYTPAVVTVAAAASMHASPTALLGGFSWALLITGFASPRVGRRIERVGGRGVMAAGTAIMAAGMALMAAWPTLAGWYVAWTVCGFGMALGLYDASFASIGRLLGAAARPAIVGVTLIGGFASSLGWPMGVALVRLLGWRATVLVYALIDVGVILPLILAFVPHAEPVAVVAERAGAPAVPAPSHGRLAFFLLAVFFSVRSAISSMVSVFALVLFQGMGLTANVAVGIATLIGPIQVGGRILEVAFGRWLNPLVTSVLGAVLLPLGVAAMLTGAPVAAFAAAYGMSNGVLTISRGTLPLHLFGARGYATRIGRLALPVMLAQAVAPTAIAPLVSRWPAWELFALMGAASGLALLCLLPLNRLIAA
ncbi:MAG: MFS transporter [Acetobacteraceae bacterium]